MPGAMLGKYYASRKGLSLALFSFVYTQRQFQISQIINTHDVSHHMYADATQVYIELSQSDTHKSISSLSDCLTDISLWMKSSIKGKNFKMCTNAYFFWEKSELSELH